MIDNTNSSIKTKTTMATSTMTATHTNSNSNSNNTMATTMTTTTTSNIKNGTAVVPVTTTNLVVPPPPPPPRPINPATPRVQHYHRSGWSKAYHLPPSGGGSASAAATAAATTPKKPSLEKIKEEGPSSLSLAYDTDELSHDAINPASKEEEDNGIHLGKKNIEGQDDEHKAAVFVTTVPQPEPQPTCRMESFMLGHEYQYKLLATTTTTTTVPPATTCCCFVPFSTIGSSGLLSSLQGQPPFVVVTDDDDDDDTSNHQGGGHDSNTKYCVVGAVEQHPSCPDDESNDSSAFNDDGDESMFWMATLNKNQPVMSARVIHLRGSEMIRFIRKMQYEDLSLMSKRHFLVYSMNDKAFVLKNSNDIVKSIQESMTCSPVEEETAKEQVNKDVVEVKVTDTGTVLVPAPATKEETEDLDDDDDDDTTQDGAVNASLDVLVPSDIMKPVGVKSTTSSSTTTNNKDDKSSSRRRRSSIKVKWMKLMRSLICLRRQGRPRGGSSGYSRGSSSIAAAAGATAAATDTITLTATHGEISPGASTLSSSSSSTTVTHGHENVGAETKKDGHSETNIIDI
jgi:hypothetical protein